MLSLPYDFESQLCVHSQGQVVRRTLILSGQFDPQKIRIQLPIGTAQEVLNKSLGE